MLTAMEGKHPRESESMEAELDHVLKRLKTLVLDPHSNRKRKSTECHEFDHVHKCLKTLVLEPDIDQISQLPDDILHQILSFFPPETVGKTFFLSKRWLNLSTTLPFLCFKLGPDCSHSETNTKLINFIEKLLSCRDKSTIIERFCLSNSNPCLWLDMTHVNDLIREVVLGGHGVHEIDLKLEYCSLHFCASTSFVSCKSLTSLKLSLSVCSKPNFPAYFSFPNLKTMELTHVTLCSNLASQLTNNCRKLENLAISKCNFVLIQSNDCSLRTLPNLFKASFSLAYVYEQPVIDLLPIISNVEVLNLKTDLPNLLIDKLEKMDYLSKFHNLKRLELGRFRKTEKRVNIIDSMLRSLPSLEWLGIGFIWYLVKSDEDGSDLIPSCRLNEGLKVIKIEGVSPSKLLIKLVKYFLEEAKGLEKMIVCKSRFYYNEAEQDNICQKLRALPNSGALELWDDDTFEWE